MPELQACPSCGRHSKREKPCCPHCGNCVKSGGRTTAAAVIGLALVSGVYGCGQELYGVPATPNDSGEHDDSGGSGDSGDTADESED